MKIYTIEEIKEIVDMVASKYELDSVFLFGSYARGTATAKSDLDFLVIGKPEFRRTLIFAFAEELREAFQKDVDVFEIHEINVGTDFCENVMKERLQVA